MSLCHHCHQTPARQGSLFCARCCALSQAGLNRDPWLGPAPIIAEPPLPRRRSFLARLLSYLRPRKEAARLRVRLREEQDARAEVERSSLALRRKCADLKMQLAAATARVDELEGHLMRRRN